MTSLNAAQDIIDSLQLVPHPEGGFFRETYRSGTAPMESGGQTDQRGQLISAKVRAGADTPSKTVTRNTMTSIYYMLTRENPVQVFACNESDLVHNWHSGGRLEYIIVRENGKVDRQVLGPKLAEGDAFQLPVPGHAYKAARLLEGDYVLLGESVAPGFDYVDMFMVSKEQLKARIGAADPELLALVSAAPGRVE